jgi:hypothetical protein
MLNIILETLQTPYLLVSLGFVTALSLFISPVLYNGDYKSATKTIAILLGYAFFSSTLVCNRMGMLIKHYDYLWVSPVILLSLVAICYIFGLMLGIFIYNKVNKH